jgi:hypothetical protein
MPDPVTWHEYGNPKVQTLITSVHESNRGLMEMAHALDLAADDCLRGWKLHLATTGHADRKKAHAQLNKANDLLQEALAGVKEAVALLNHP